MPFSSDNASPLPQVPESFAVRMADFSSMAEALDYAAMAGTGMIFHGAAGKISHSLTYGAIRRRAIDLAKRLLGLGLLRGERVGIIADMHPDFVSLFSACQYAGLLAVPLPVITGLGGRQGYRKQLRRVLETSGARAAFGGPESLGDLEAAAANLDLVMIATTASLADRNAADVVLQPLAADEPSHIQYSSGSTRHPHGIEISQRALLANTRSIAMDGVRFNRTERVASWLPFYHDMGLIGCMIGPIVCQFTVYYLHTDAFARRPLQWLKLMSDNRCTISFSPTFGYDICARRAVGKDDLAFDLSSWRYAGIGGDMIQPEVFVRFAETFAPYGFAAKALNASYGLAEATLALSFATHGLGITADTVDKQKMASEGVALAPVKDHRTNQARSFASCGRPMRGYALEIRNDRGAALDDRQVGQVFIKGPSLMSGYFRDPEATAACMPGDGWLNTGDMGYTVAGELFVTGRSKDMMIVNGRNIWPQDIEWHAENNVETLRSRDTAAFAIEADDGRDVPVILVQCRVQTEDDRNAMKKAVHAAVFRNTGVDCRVELIPQRSLPFTTSGKLSRARARKSWLAGAYAFDRPSGADEKIVAA